MTLNFGKMEYWGDSIPHRPNELSYIKQVPLPIADIPQGAKIKARCIDRMTILEPSIPDRKQVRKQNYDRRLDQMNNQGFVSVIYEPYKPIGHPVYLDNGRLIKDTLGLPHGDSDEETEKSVTPAVSTGDQKEAQMPFMLRRSRKQLNTLKKEIERGRNLLRNVKLGHGLFKVLADEWNKTVNRREIESEIEKQKQMMNWQLARADADSPDCSDDELNEEEDLRKYFVQLEVPEYARPIQTPMENREHVRFNVRPETHTGHIQDEKYLSPDRLMSAPVRRRKGQSPRPYTPNHSNISHKKLQHGKIAGETMFRQLCCLHWILKTMDLPESATISPLICCWELNSDRMGGEEYIKRQIEEKKAKDQAKYDEIFKQPKQKGLKKRSTLRADKKRSWHPLRSHRSGSFVRSRSDSVTHSIISNDVPSTPLTDNHTATLDEPVYRHDVLEIDNSTITEEPTQLPFDDSLTVLTLNVDSIQGNSRPPTRQPISSAKEFGRLTKEEEKQMELAKQLEEAAKMDNAPMERMMSKLFRATNIIKPKNSKELMEFKQCCLSSKLVHRNKEMRQSWAEVKEERALRLHDELDFQEKNRLRTCQNKFMAMSTNSSSFHRSLKTMRVMNDYMRRETEKEKNKQQDQSKYARWYDELVTLVPPDCKNLWYFQRILDKLRIYGDKYGPDNKTESSSKASEHKFTRVLRLIRSWEICSPNVAAAVEFCRDRIIDMSEQEFEELFQHTFPAIERPKTAPVK